MSTAELTRIDHRPIADNRQEIRAFMMVWNESIRLQSTLKHYRELGVDRFFVIDLGSTDGTLDLLAAEPEVHVFTATGNAEVAYLNALLDTHGAGHWSLTVDADELFIYPHYEELELPLFCRYLSHAGSQAVACLSLDMYATSPIGDAVHRPGTSLLGTCSYFDAAPYSMVRTNVCPYFEIHGGVRERIFGQATREGATGMPPVLTRVPLVRWQVGMQYLRGTGNVTPVSISHILGTLLRFEFLSDYHARSGGDPAFSNSTNLYCERSVKFEDSAQLVALNLMTTAKAYEESVRRTAEARAAAQSRQAG
ncbi:MAG TPA: glycosyltransferase family 2 protein [Xanthobacteraceae bacterium]